jgi:hypothetical protein
LDEVRIGSLTEPQQLASFGAIDLCAVAFER